MSHRAGRTAEHLIDPQGRAAFLILHHATLTAIAQQHPSMLDDLQDISGTGTNKLEA